MIGSRAINLLKTVSRFPKISNFLQQVRKDSHGANHDPCDGWCYREPKPPPKWAMNQSIMVATLMYWWIYWNLYHGWEHIIGLYDGKPLPNPRKWTDEELGIPPD